MRRTSYTFQKKRKIKRKQKRGGGTKKKERIKTKRIYKKYKQILKGGAAFRLISKFQKDFLSNELHKTEEEKPDYVWVFCNNEKCQDNISEFIPEESMYDTCVKGDKGLEMNEAGDLYPFVDWERCRYYCDALAEELTISYWEPLRENKYPPKDQTSKFDLNTFLLDDNIQPAIRMMFILHNSQYRYRKTARKLGNKPLCREKVVNGQIPIGISHVDWDGGDGEYSDKELVSEYDNIEQLFCDLCDFLGNQPEKNFFKESKEEEAAEAKKKYGLDDEDLKEMRWPFKNEEGEEKYYCGKNHGGKNNCYPSCKKGYKRIIGKQCSKCKKYQEYINDKETKGVYDPAIKIRILIDECETYIYDGLVKHYGEEWARDLLRDWLNFGPYIKTEKVKNFEEIKKGGDDSVEYDILEEFYKEAGFRDNVGDGSCLEKFKESAYSDIPNKTARDNPEIMIKLRSMIGNGNKMKHIRIFYEHLFDYIGTLLIKNQDKLYRGGEKEWG